MLLIIIIITAIIFVIIGATSCAQVRYVPAGTTDSTRVVVRDSLVRDTVLVKIPVEKVVEVRAKADTSILETSIAEFVAFIDNKGFLNYSLTNKSDKELEAPIFYKEKIITKEKYRVINHIQEVERELTWWQKFKMLFGSYAMVACGGIILHYVYKIIRGLKIF